MFETKEGVIKPIVYVGIVRDGKLLLVDYKEAPNPAKKGWWIPAPGLKFGEDPMETAQKVAEDFGFKDASPKLKNVESFVLPGGWHFICHFIVSVKGDPQKNENINQYKWVNAQELEGMKDIAHGKWEIGIGKSFLDT